PQTPAQRTTELEQQLARVGKAELRFQLSAPLGGSLLGCRGHDSSPHILSRPGPGARESVLPSEIENRIFWKILEAAEEQKFLRRGGPRRRRRWMWFQWRAAHRGTPSRRGSRRAFSVHGAAYP